MSESLTVERLYEAYDILWRFPQEEYFYVCHPDSLVTVRGAFAEERWGTCPMIRARNEVPPGKVLQIKYRADPDWLWPWQR